MKQKRLFGPNKTYQCVNIIFWTLVLPHAAYEITYKLLAQDSHAFISLASSVTIPYRLLLWAKLSIHVLLTCLALPWPHAFVHIFSLAKNTKNSFYLFQSFSPLSTLSHLTSSMNILFRYWILKWPLSSLNMSDL